jgi:broad specificity phosphatase PhoE
MTAPLPRPPAPAPVGDYERWLAEYPAPDLQAFVRQYGDWRRLPPDVWESFPPEQQARVKVHGSYRAVTPEEWAILDQRVAEWQARRRSRHQADRMTEERP